MDPLSITASTVTLLGVVGKVTMGLGALIQSLRTVDSRLTFLCEELSDLQGSLQAIRNAIQWCKRFDFNLVEDGLWQQSETALGHCHSTVNELALLVEKIRHPSWPNNMAWKIRVIIDVKIYAEDLTTFRDKIRQSNAAMQTMLQIMNVCLSIKQNASHNHIISGLHHLEKSINTAWRAIPTSSRPPSRFRGIKIKPESCITKNLHHLAAGAENFYTSVSSRTSAIQSSDCHQISRPSSNGQTSPLSGFSHSASQYERFLQDFDHLNPIPKAEQPPLHEVRIQEKDSKQLLHRLLNEPARKTTASCETTKASSRFDGPQYQEIDEYLELVFLHGLKELSIESIKAQEYDKAIKLLKGVILGELGSQNGINNYREMYTQLIFCYIIKGQWRLAEPLVEILVDSTIVKSEMDNELVISHFAHALALCHLNELAFDQSLRYCKHSLSRKRKLCQASLLDWAEYQKTLALLITIYEISGDNLRAEIYRRQLPYSFIYLHPANEIEFMKAHTNILITIIGPGIPDASNNCGLYTGQASTILETHGNQAMCHIIQEYILEREIAKQEKDEIDTSKEVLFCPDNLQCKGDDSAPRNAIKQSALSTHDLPLRRQTNRQSKSQIYQSSIEYTGSTLHADSLALYSLPDKGRSVLSFSESPRCQTRESILWHGKTKHHLRFLAEKRTPANEAISWRTYLTDSGHSSWPAKLVNTQSIPGARHGLKNDKPATPSFSDGSNTKCSQCTRFSHISSPKQYLSTDFSKRRSLLVLSLRATARAGAKSDKCHSGIIYKMD